jgi:hypothetical protein
LVEHATENRGVVSSILTLGTLGQSKRPSCGCSSVVERLLAKEKVVGSNPIARSVLLSMASWPSGKARVCKTLITGSNPVDASEIRCWLPGKWEPAANSLATSGEVAFCIEVSREEVV